MVLVESFESRPGESGAVHFNMMTSILPRDVLKDVGLTVTPIPAPLVGSTKTNAKLSLVRMPTPFTPTEKLQAHFRSNGQEYGTAGREKYPLPFSTIVWKITLDGIDEAGFVWLDEVPNSPGVKNLLMAVYADYASKGLGAAALRLVESQNSELGFSEIHAQVNNNRPETGLRTRRWLKREGFQLYDKRPANLAHTISDDDYIVRYPSPVHLKKTYDAGGDV